MKKKLRKELNKLLPEGVKVKNGSKFEIGNSLKCGFTSA